MNEQLKLYYTAQLLASAIEMKGHDIIPVSGNKRFRDGLQVFRSKIYLYFNHNIEETFMVGMELEHEIQ